MHIFIPTKGRGPRNQKTYDKLRSNADGLYPMYLVCPPDEVSSFQAAGYSVLGCDASRIGATRQWIVDTSIDRKILMLDDDLHQWATRPDPQVGKYRPSTAQDIHDTLRSMDNRLSSYAHAGIGARLFANNQPPTAYNARITRAWGLRTDIIKKYDLKFTCPVDDLEMTIQLLRAGYANVVDYITVQDQAASQSAGGASLYRTVDYHNACHEQIHRWHPKYTRLVEKTTKGGWFDGTPRKEVVISWGKLISDFVPTTIDKHPGYIKQLTRDADETR